MGEMKRGRWRGEVMRERWRGGGRGEGVGGEAKEWRVGFSNMALPHYTIRSYDMIRHDMIRYPASAVLCWATDWCHAMSVSPLSRGSAIDECTHQTALLTSHQRISSICTLLCCWLVNWCIDLYIDLYIRRCTCRQRSSGNASSGSIQSDTYLCYQVTGNRGLWQHVCLIRI